MALDRDLTELFVLDRGFRLVEVHLGMVQTVEETIERADFLMDHLPVAA